MKVQLIIDCNTETKEWEITVKNKDKSGEPIDYSVLKFYLREAVKGFSNSVEGADDTDDRVYRSVH
jgi:hypothetical protein